MLDGRVVGSSPLGPNVPEAPQGMREFTTGIIKIEPFSSQAWARGPLPEAPYHKVLVRNLGVDLSCIGKSTLPEVGGGGGAGLRWHQLVLIKVMPLRVGFNHSPL